VSRLFSKVLFLCTGLLLSGLILQGCATTRLDAKPAVQTYQTATNLIPGVADERDNGLRIMTLNIAHGRGDSFHQLLQRSATTVANLDAIVTLLKDSGADVVALQEADGPSFWSGNFNHIDYLADNGSFSQSVHGVHVDGLGLSYGTALIANLDLRDPQAITFDPALSPVPKGFVVSTISWPGSPDIDVDIVSVHLDFASRSTRKKQAMELIETLKDRKRPVIIMGDFNAEWQKNSTVQYISQELALSTFSPDGTGLETFPAFGERLDWILVSAGISFRSYQVIPDTVSDHRGVIAELALDMTTLLTGDD
jgi:endonuclease/exonuclease/phosphatase family metal-dependent hydrolase